MCCGRCPSHSTHYPILLRLFARPLQKSPIAANGSKAANQGLILPFLPAAVHYRKMPLLALDPVAVRLRWPIPADPLVGEKQMLRFTNIIITHEKNG